MIRQVHFPHLGKTFPSATRAAEMLGTTYRQVQEMIRRGDAHYVPVKIVIERSGNGK